MQICVDSNILVYSLNELSPFRVQTLRSTHTLRSGGGELVIFPQNLIEFWAVATRPTTSNGLAFSPLRAAEAIADMKTVFNLIPESGKIFLEWQRLVVHDARITAQMRVNRIESILTFNARDFARYSDINVIDPLSM